MTLSTHLSTHRLSLERIEQAATLIDPVFLNSPQFICEPLGHALGTQLALKIETLNPIRSFKGRGADFLVSQVQDAGPLICASAGNFGQAMAYAGRKRDCPSRFTLALAPTLLRSNGCDRWALPSFCKARILMPPNKPPKPLH